MDRSPAATGLGIVAPAYTAIAPAFQISSSTEVLFSWMTWTAVDGTLCLMRLGLVMAVDGTITSPCVPMRHSIRQCLSTSFPYNAHTFCFPLVAYLHKYSDFNAHSCPRCLWLRTLALDASGCVVAYARFPCHCQQRTQ